MTTGTHTLFAAYCVGLAAYLWEVTVSHVIKWRQRDIAHLEYQLALCRRYPMPERRGDVYYKGNDLSQAEAAVCLAQSQCDMKALQKKSLLTLCGIVKYE